jgi:hypothetical protein
LKPQRGGLETYPRHQGPLAHSGERCRGMAEAPSSNLGWSTTGLAVGSGRSSQDCRHGVRFPTAPPFLLGSSNGRTSGCYPPNVGSNPTPRANLRRSSNGQDPCFSGTTVGVRISVAAPRTRSSMDKSFRLRTGRLQVRLLPCAPIYRVKLVLEESRAWNAEAGGQNTAP